MTIYELCLSHSHADRALRTIIAEQLQEARLTMMQWLLLGVLAEAPKQGLSMSEVAAKLGITLPQVTALTTDLTERRLAKLKTQSKDRRSRHALLTAKGEELLHSATKQVDTSLEALFPEEKRQAYVELVKTFIEKPDNA